MQKLQTQMGLMEKGTSWISLFISLAPMLGFLGTVLGMIESFDAIEEAGGIKPTVVAGGIKTALITTVAGLIVAIILQVFYNFIVSKFTSSGIRVVGGQKTLLLYSEVSRAKGY